MTASPVLKSSRHRSREVALQVLFAIDVHERRGATEVDSQTVFDDVACHFEMPAGAKEFARTLAQGTHAQRAELDARITSHARNWRIERMGTVDRNILRLATWELAHTETPAAVVMDEAVELAQRFGEDRTASFVNGILDAVARELAEVEA